MMDNEWLPPGEATEPLRDCTTGLYTEGKELGQFSTSSYIFEKLVLYSSCLYLVATYYALSLCFSNFDLIHIQIIWGPQ